MSWNLVPSLAAVLASLYAARMASPDVQFDFQLAAPKVEQGPLAPTPPTPPATQIPPSSLTMVNGDEDSSQKISVNLHNADLHTVLSALEGHGVSFVIADKDLKEQTITMHIEDQPVNQVADAVAMALGGHWMRNGKVLVFQKGLAPFAFFNSSNFPSDVFNGKKLLFKERLENSDAFKKEMLGQKQMAKDIQEKMAEDMKSRGMLLRDQELGNSDVTNKQLQDLLKKSEDLKAQSRDLQLYVRRDGGANLDSLTFERRDLGKLMHSLTHRQKDLQEEQGYLKITDLTPEQQAMAGLSGMKGEFEIKIKLDGQELTIKS